MKKNYFLLCLLILLSVGAFAQENQTEQTQLKTKSSVIVDHRIDNMHYWRELAAKGVVAVAQKSNVPLGVYSSSKIEAFSVITEDSPDHAVAENSTTQSENSIFINPSNIMKVINSNNSTNNPFSEIYGANYFFSNDGSETWEGTEQGAGGDNSGDPATAISLGGRMYIGFIHSNYGQGVSYSADNGFTWTSVQAGVNSGDMLDKNHLWIDNSSSSPYEGNVYDAWTPFGGSNDTEIEIVRSNDGGLTYSAPLNISSAVNAGSHNQGVNIQTGPEGQVYVAWAIYDDWYGNGYEEAIGFAKSTDGGATYAPATRIIADLKGIRGGISKNQRVNSFPSMAADISGGQFDGNIYIVWANTGVPGTNSGSNVSVYMIKSEDEGATWSTPLRVNQGEFAEGKVSYFPWITCDPETGTLSVIFYDDRNVGTTQCETWVANSYDAGETWEDFKISDVSFTPAPIAGLADGYMGDYLGITARGGIVYPVWTDNRTGEAMTYVSPFETNNRVRPENLLVDLNSDNGQTNLTWEFTDAKVFQNFVVYRDNVEIGTTTDLFFEDNLPDYGYYTYKVTAMHEDGESGAVKQTIRWGTILIDVNPTSLSEELGFNQSSVQQLTVSNNGQLDLTFNTVTEITSKLGDREYCTASASTQDEYISNVEFGDINNSTGWTSYSDFTSLSTTLSAGESVPITITNGNPWSADECGIWIDWNQDGDFEDTYESIVMTNGSGDGPYTSSITPPASAIPGNTRMRIRLDYSNTPTPCGESTYGEVEDYSVNVISWLQSDIYSGTVQSGNSQIINVTFNSNNLTEGTYSAEIKINSNSDNNTQIIVPVTLVVSGDYPLTVNPIASPEEICNGESSQLFSNITGGTGSNTITWTSNPAGFSSSEANPTVNPTQTTTYNVSVNDGETTQSGQVTVYIVDNIETPSVPTGETNVAANGDNTIYQTEGVDFATSYLWQITPSAAGTISGTGTSGIVDWNSDFSGQAFISVKAINNCGESVYSNELTVNATYVGINEELNKISYIVYPNPTDGLFVLELNSKFDDIINLNVYNSAGTEVFSKKNIEVWAKNSWSIDLQSFPAGEYFLNITGKTENKTIKIIVQ